MEGQYIKGEIHITVTRADGSVEDFGKWKNLFLNEGMDYLADFQATTTTSVMNHMVVGTTSTAATLTNVVNSMGEVARNTMATRTVAANILTEVGTFAGFADSVTSAQIVELGIINDTRSGPNGELRSRSVFSQVVLADSDHVRFEYQTTVGSR